MTILIVLIGLLISHFATGFRHVRRFGWLMWPVRWGRARFPDQPWLPLVLVLLISLLGSVAVIWLVTAMLGVVGWSLLALAVFIFTLGPRDLDHDVRTLVDPLEDPERTASAATAMQLTLDDSAAGSCAAVFHAALSRWFGLLFWFVVLGIPGAVLYRLSRVAFQLDNLNQEELQWLTSLRRVLDWPILVLMGISAALCGDLDRVHQAWKAQRENAGKGLVAPQLLDRIAAVTVSEDADFAGGLIAGHQMVWRMLVLWLVVLSLLLLAGWLA